MMSHLRYDTDVRRLQALDPSNLGYTLGKQKPCCLSYGELRIDDQRLEGRGFSKDRIVININGHTFETQLGTLHRFPNTLLGDPARRRPYFNKARKEYFFDRDKDSFDAILFYYQSNGELHRPMCVPIELFMKEVRFFELGDDVFGDWKRSEGIMPKNRELPINSSQRRIWLLFEYPGSSMAANCICCLSLLALSLSITMMCIETLPQNQYYRLLNTTETRRFEALVEDYVTKMDDAIFVIRSCCHVWFVLEYLVRLISSPHKLRFLKRIYNILVVITLIPYFITLCLALSRESREQYLGSRIEIIRVLRVIQLARYSRYFGVLIQSYKRSATGILFVFVIMCIAVITFASAIYFAERDLPHTDFHSIPDIFPFIIDTLATLGSAKESARSPWTKLIIFFCLISGIITVALCISILNANFKFLYSRNIREDDVLKKAEMAKPVIRRKKPYYVIYQLGPNGGQKSA